MSNCGCNKINNVKVQPMQIKELQNDIDLLVANRMMAIDEAAYSNAKVQQAMDHLKLAVNMLYDTKQYDDVMYMIMKAKKKIGNLELKPQTVGAYLFGCTMDNYGDVKDNSYSALCSGSVPTKPKMSCNNFIFYHNGDVLKQLATPSNKAKKSDVLMYVEPNFKGLTQFQHDQVAQAISGYTIGNILVYTTKNNKHTLINTLNSLSQVPIVSMTGPTGMIGTSIMMGSSGGTGGVSRGLYVSTSTLFWLVVLIVLIILIIAGLGWWKSNNRD